MTNDWRPLTELEATSWAKARLGGGLLGLFVLACLLSIVLVAALALVAIDVRNIFLLGREFSFKGAIGFFGMTNLATALTILLLGPVFLVMTLLRSPATPRVIALGLCLIFCLQLVTGLSGTLFAMIATGSGLRPIGLVAHFLPSWIGFLALLIATSADLIGGVRPNAYYLRRVAFPPATFPPSHKAPSRPA